MSYIRVQTPNQSEQVYTDYGLSESITVKVRHNDFDDMCTGRIKLQTHNDWIPFTFAWYDFGGSMQLEDWTNHPITEEPTEVPYSLYIREVIERTLEKKVLEYLEVSE